MLLCLERAAALRRLLLKRPERVQAAGGREHLFHGVGAERAEKLPLEVGLADVHVLEHAPEDVRLVLVAKTAQPRAGRRLCDEAADRVRAADRSDLDPLGREVTALPPREQLEDSAIADPFDGDEERCIHG